jgi:hypothetical protein
MRAFSDSLPYLYPLRLFSSHCWKYGHHRVGIHELLSPEWTKDVDYIDLSVPESHPLHCRGDDWYLCNLLSDRISISDVVLVMAGTYASYSYWMKVEVALACLHNRPILPIAPNGQQRLSRTATALSEFEAVRWRGRSMRMAILNVIDPVVRKRFLDARLLRTLTALSAQGQPLRRLPVWPSMPLPPK